uniref:Chloride channel, voltage-sensitive 4 n=1 Tax=Seriola dumerili TaxID=41447 RepID=A0A3B4V7M3_SERDU
RPERKASVCRLWYSHEQVLLTSNETTFRTTRRQSVRVVQKWAELIDWATPGCGEPTFELLPDFWALLFLPGVHCASLAPYACGSGTQRSKTILSGFIIRATGWNDALIRRSQPAAGVRLQAWEGGPLIHVPAAQETFASLFSSTARNEGKRREVNAVAVLSAAAAAGVSVAFGRRCGGVLFSLEEVIISLETLGSFFAALVAAFTLRSITRLQQPAGLFYVETYAVVSWRAGPFICWACFGALGDLFIRANIAWCRGGRPPAGECTPVLEVIAVRGSPPCWRSRNRTPAATSELISELSTSPSLFIPAWQSERSPAIVGIAVADGVSQPRLVIFKNWCRPGADCVTPGLYAMVELRGDRMTVLLVVIMFELTRKWVADAFGKGELYESHIPAQRLPHLDIGTSSPTDPGHRRDAARSQERPPLAVLTRTAPRWRTWKTLIKATDYNGFPVVVSREVGGLIGFVQRRDLPLSIKNARQKQDGVVSSSSSIFTEDLRRILNLSPFTVTAHAMETVVDISAKQTSSRPSLCLCMRLPGIITKEERPAPHGSDDEQDPESIISISSRDESRSAQAVSCTAPESPPTSRQASPTNTLHVFFSSKVALRFYLKR